MRLLSGQAHIQQARNTMNTRPLLDELHSRMNDMSPVDESHEGHGLFEFMSVNIMRVHPSLIRPREERIMTPWL
jgi:hypothetical protein